MARSLIDAAQWMRGDDDAQAVLAGRLPATAGDPAAELAASGPPAAPGCVGRP